MLKIDLYIGKFRKIIEIILINIIAVTSLSFADTHIPGGNVSGIWNIGDSPYIIDGEINIPIDSTLIIEPGVQVIFSGHYKFNIYGRLLAVGAASDTISFTIDDTTGFSNPDTTAGGWHGLRFYDVNTNGQDSSKILYSKLEYGKATGSGDGQYGGAIYLVNSSDILIKNCVITKNSAKYGGGLSCDNSSPNLANTRIIRNTANYGGGICCNNNSYPSLEGVTITENIALLVGGGAYCIDNSGLNFSALNRCNIFLNYAGAGNDLYAFNPPAIEVIVDTFTVLEPDDHFAHPIDNFTFDILNGKVEPANQNLYVSPNGSNNNSGLSPEDPLKTISYALVKIASDETNPNTIHLANGIYSSSQTGEIFPLNCRSYVSLQGEDEISTILDGQGLSSILCCRTDSIFSVENLTAQNGCASIGSGIYCYESNLTVTNVTIYSNGYSFEKAYPFPKDKKKFSHIIEEQERIFSYTNNPSKVDNPFIDSDFFDFYPCLEDDLQKSRAIGLGGGIFCAHSTLNLSNVVISENSTPMEGGGIYFEYSDADLNNVEVTGNIGELGGGIYCYNSNLFINNTIISGNTVDGGYARGGGISSYYSNLQINNAHIIGNSAYVDYVNNGNNGEVGGGIFSGNSDISLSNATIIGNSARYGGGIYCSNSTPDLDNVIISENTASANGGALYLYNSTPSLTAVTITGNNAKYCGGIALDNSTINFDTENRCNIYLNYGGDITDLIANYNCPVIDVIVDTFTVLLPNEYFASPTDYFTFDILNGRVEPVNQDLYVSPTGSNNNSGLTADEPLKTISYALVKIAPDSLSPHTIHIADGVYSSSQTGEKFPLNCRSYISLQGENEDLTILDGESLHGILYGRNDNNFSIRNMTIQNGYTPFGGGILCEFSSLDISNITLKDNFAHFLGGGISFWHSNSNLTNVTIKGNTADIGRGGGISCDYYSTSFLINLLISHNSSTNGGGISCYDNSATNLINVTISENTASTSGGGAYCFNNSNMSLVNCILWNDVPHEINSSSVSATYSDIQGGWTGEGNIDEDPLFANPGNGNFRLITGSPCIDMGTPDTTGLNLPLFDLDGNPRIYNGIIDMGAYEWQGFDVDEPNIPSTGTKLYQNFPNPFSTSTTISFNLHHRDTENAEIKIYNIKGQLVRELGFSISDLGFGEAIWDGKDSSGKTVPSGVYLYRITTDSFTSETKKMILIR